MTAFQDPLKSKSIYISGTSMEQQPLGTTVPFLAQVARFAEVIAQPKETVHDPGPGLFWVQSWWHGGLWTFPHPSWIFQGGWVSFHHFSLLSGWRYEAGLDEEANNLKHILWAQILFAPLSLGILVSCVFPVAVTKLVGFCRSPTSM